MGRVREEGPRGRGRVLREESGEGPLGGSSGAWGGDEGRGAGARVSVPTPWAWSEREASKAAGRSGSGGGRARHLVSV